MSKAGEPVTFPAAVNKVTTLADGGIRIALDLPEDAIVEAAWLMQCKRDGVVLRIVATPLINSQEQSDGLEERPKRKSYWTPNKGTGANCDSGKNG